MWHYLASIFRDICGCTVCIQGKWPSRQTDNHSNYCKFASQKFWSAEELLTLPVGTKPWTSHHPLPGGDRHRKEALDDLPSKDGTRSSSTRSTLELLQRQHSKFLINGTERIWAFSNVYTSNWTGLLFWNSQNISFCQKHIFYTSCVLPEKAQCPNLSLLFQDIRKKENKVSQIAAPFIADNIKTFLRFTQQNCTMPLLRHKDWTIFTNIVNNEDTVPVKMVNTTMCN